MQGLLYVCHGTRLPIGKQQSIDFLQSIHAEVDAPLQELCFLEICSPTLEQGVEKLVRQGATEIGVIPLLLLSAKHDQVDIPLELSRIRRNYPWVSFSYGRPLGVQSRIIDILAERVKELANPLDPEEEVLLVGRGSSVLSTPRDVRINADMLSTRINKKVRVAFLAACKPSFTDVLVEFVDRNDSIEKSMVVVPYIWFDGLLMQSIKRKVDQFNDVGAAPRLKLCSHLGNHPNMKAAFIEHANELLQGWGECEERSS